MFACLFERVSEWMSVSMVWHFGDAEKYISIVIVLAWFLFCSAALLGLVLQRCDFDAVGFVVVVVALIHSFVKSKSRAKREKWKFLSLEKLLFILWYYLNFMFWVVLLSIPFISGSWAWAALVELSLCICGWKLPQNTLKMVKHFYIRVQWGYRNIRWTPRFLSEIVYIYFSTTNIFHIRIQYMFISLE